jgi:hypothetical protein
MARFRKKPVVIDAVQWTGDLSALRQWCAEIGASFPGGPNGDSIEIFTPEGMMTASPGDFIIRGVKGEFYPCKPDIFAATYEAVD